MWEGSSRHRRMVSYFARVAQAARGRRTALCPMLLAKPTRHAIPRSVGYEVQSTRMYVYGYGRYGEAETHDAPIPYAQRYECTRFGGLAVGDLLYKFFGPDRLVPQPPTSRE